MNNVYQELNPGNAANLLWTPDKDGFVLPNTVEAVAEEFNRTPYERQVAEVAGHAHFDKQTGIEYGIWNGDEQSRGEYSQTDAIVMFSTFATRIDTNMLLRGEFCFRVFQACDIRDEQGKRLPLIFIGSPAHESTLHLSRDQKRQIAHGDLGPVAAEQLKKVRSLGYGRVALLGFSQGGSMAAAGARIASNLDMEATHVGAGSSPNILERWPLLLQLNFMGQGKYLRKDIDKGGIDAFVKVHEAEYSELAYAKAMISRLGLNFAFFRGMSKNRLGEDLAKAYEKNPNLRLATAVATGGRDKVGRDAETHIVVEALRDMALGIGAVRPHHITIENGQHSWGDRVKLLAAFYAYALSIGR